MGNRQSINSGPGVPASRLNTFLLTFRVYGTVAGILLGGFEMKSNSRLSLAIVGACALFVVVALPSIAVANNSWGGYHWARTSNPFTLRLGNNTTGTWTGHLSTASSDWSQSTVLDTSIVAGRTKPKVCRPWRNTRTTGRRTKRKGTNAS